MLDINWQVFLANSEDMSIEAEITSFCRDKNLQLGYNKAGAVNFNVPMNWRTLEYTNTNSNCVIFRRNNETRWSGPLATKEMDWENEKIILSAVGWFDTLMDRYIEESIPGPYTGANLGVMAFALLAIANADKDTYISAGSNTCTSTTNKAYEGWESIGEEINALSELEAGYNYYVHPETRQLNINHWNEYTVNNNVNFGYNWGSDNITAMPHAEDGSAMRNKVWAVGETTAYEDQDNTSISENVLQKTEVIQLNESDDSTYLQTILQAELVMKKDPLITISFDCKPTSDEGNPFHVFEDFNLGDQVPVVGKIEIDSEETEAGDPLVVSLEYDARIFAFTIEIDNENKERVKSFETSYQGG